MGQLVAIKRKMKVRLKPDVVGAELEPLYAIVEQIETLTPAQIAVLGEYIKEILTVFTDAQKSPLVIDEAV